MVEDLIISSLLLAHTPDQVRSREIVSTALLNVYLKHLTVDILLSDFPLNRNYFMSK